MALVEKFDCTEPPGGPTRRGGANKIWADIRGISHITDVEELDDLQDRVERALANTEARIARHRAESGGHDPDGAAWLARAEHARDKFVRSIRRIDGRRGEIRRGVANRDAPRRREHGLENSRLNIEAQARASAEISRVKQEEKTRRHIIATRDRKALTLKHLRHLLIERGVAAGEEAVHALLSEAQGLADAELTALAGAETAGGPAEGR